MASLRSTARPGRLLPPPGGGLPPRRRWLGLGALCAGLPVITMVLVPMRDSLALGSVLLVYQLAVVLIAVIGGWLPALAAALASSLLANFFFTTPYNTLLVETRDSLVALVVFVLVAATVSVSVDVAARGRVSSLRSRIEAEALSRISAAPATDTSLAAILEQVRETFGMTSVLLLQRHDGQDQVAARVGHDLPGQYAITVDLDDQLRLVAQGPQLFAEDRQVLRRLGAAAARAWESQQLAGQAARARHLAEVDQLRAALLAAVGHELRTPLASVKAASSGLRQREVTLTAQEQDELLATVEESADRLDDLIANLLAMSRLQAGAMSVTLRPIALDEVVGRALIGLHVHDVDVHVPDDLPAVLADAGLLERAVANLVSNACRFSPPGRPVRVEAQVPADRPDHVRLRVVDAGPGVPEADRERMFAPFERLGPRAASDGVGLGLAIARGFSEAMDTTLSPSGTPGGGLTMTLDLAVAP